MFILSLNILKDIVLSIYDGMMNIQYIVDIWLVRFKGKRRRRNSISNNVLKIFTLQLQKKIYL
jgi:hypothetical protein